MFVTPLLLLSFQGSQPQPSPAVQKEVVVTAPRHDVDVLDVPSSVTVITRQDIEKSNAHDIVEVLRNQPGLSVQKFSSTPQDSGVEARGFLNGGGAGSRTVVLVDGRKVNDATSNAVDWASIPIDTIDRIEIIRGPGTGLYGDGAIGTVILITTRRPGKKAHHLVGAESGTFRSFKQAGSFEISEGPTGIAFYAGHRRSHGFRENSAYDGLDASGTFTHDVGIGSLFFKLSSHDDDRERPGTLSKAQIAMVGREGSVTQGDTTAASSQSADLGADLDIEGGRLSPLASFTVDRAVGVITGFGGTFSSDDESTRLALGLKYVRTMGDFTVVAGVDGTIEAAQADSDFASPGFNSQSDQEYERTIWGPYARVEWKAAPDIIVSASVRQDRGEIEFTEIYQDDFTPRSQTEGSESFSAVSPQAGVTWHVRPRTSLYAAWGGAARFPNRDELIGFITSGLALDPETSTSYEIGVRTREWEAVRGSLSIYYIDVQDEIFFMPPAYGDASGNFGGNVNIPETNHRGVEIEVDSTPAAGLEAFATATFQETTVTDGPHEGNDFPLTPGLAGRVGARYEILGGLSFQATWRYTGERHLTNDIENGSEELPAYAVVDLKLSFRRNLVTLYVEMNNAADREYFDSGGLRFPAFLQPFPGVAAFSPAPGTNYVVGGSLEF